MPMVAHQLISENLTRVTFQSFGKDPLEGQEVVILFEDDTSGVTTIQGVVDRISFIGSFRSRHTASVSGADVKNNDS